MQNVRNHTIDLHSLKIVIRLQIICRGFSILIHSYGWALRWSYASTKKTYVWHTDYLKPRRDIMTSHNPTFTSKRIHIVVMLRANCSIFFWVRANMQKHHFLSTATYSRRLNRQHLQLKGYKKVLYCAVTDSNNSPRFNKTCHFMFCIQHIYVCMSVLVRHKQKKQ